jgi:hypothetical protein
MALQDYPDTDKVIACIDDATSRVQSVAELEKRVVTAYDENDAMDQLKGLTRWPAAVIQYEGIRAVSESDKSSMKIGASTEMYLTVMVINQGQSLVKTDTKVPTIRLLTLLRRKFLGQTSPSGHKWCFVVEAAAETKQGLIFWVQRWRVPLQLQVHPQSEA